MGDGRTVCPDGNRMTSEVSVSGPVPPRILLFSRYSERPSEPPIVESLHEALGTGKDYDYRRLTLAADIESETLGAECSVLFVNCHVKEDVADLYRLLPKLEARAVEGTLRILVLNAIGHPGLADLLRARCPLDVVELPLPIKTAQYKLKQALTLVSRVRSQRAAENEALNAEMNRVPKSRREILVADARIGPAVGLGTVTVPGVRAGAESFAGVELSAEALRRNGTVVSPPALLHVYELTEKGAVILVPSEWESNVRRLNVRFRLQTGEKSAESVMDWEFTQVELKLEDHALVGGKFKSGEFDRLLRLLDRFEARKAELKVFYDTARG